MSWDLGLLALAGLAAGYINAVAGAGSLLTLPALIFTGMDAGAANATNRIAVLFQGLAAGYSFHRHGLRLGKVGWVALPAAVFAGVGAYLAAQVSDGALTVVIAVVMVTFLPLTLIPTRKPEAAEGQEGEAGQEGQAERERVAELDGHEKRLLNQVVAPKQARFSPWMLIGFAAIGLYAGFLQAGVGILILLYLSLAHRVSLVEANHVKVVAILALTVVSLGVFFATGVEIDLFRGAILAVSTSIGAFVGARAALKRGQKFVRWMMIAAVLASVVKLAWDTLSSG